VAVAEATSWDDKEEYGGADAYIESIYELLDRLLRDVKSEVLHFE
jgi:hypothetical protein